MNLQLKCMLIGMLGLLIVGSTYAQNEMRAKFDLKKAEIDLAYEQAAQLAGKLYQRQLDTRMDALQQAGNLDGYLAVKALKDQVIQNQTAPAAPFASDAATEFARRGFLRAMNDVGLKQAQQTSKLLEAYVAALPNQIKQLVQQGNVEAALTVKADLATAETELAAVRAQLPVRDQGRPIRPGGSAPMGAAKFIRLHIDSSNSAREVQLAEIEFYRGDELIPVEVKEFSSEYNSGWAAKRIVDGETNTGWANADAEDENYPHWFLLEAKDQRPFQLNHLRLHTRHAGAGNYRVKTFSVYTSMDGRTWRKCLEAELDGEKEAGWEAFPCKPIGRGLTFE